MSQQKFKQNELTLTNKSLSINGFSVYKMRRCALDIYRVKEINNNCKFIINANDVILTIDNVSVSSWCYQQLLDYLSQNCIQSITTEDYFSYKRKSSTKCNPVAVPSKKQTKPTSTTPNILSVYSNNNICCDSGTLSINLNVYLLIIFLF